MKALFLVFAAAVVIAADVSAAKTLDIYFAGADERK